MAIGAGMSAVLLLGVAGSAFAADPNPTPPPAMQRGWQRGPMMGGPQVGSVSGAGFGYQTMTESLSKLLGIPAEDIHTQRLAGKSLVQIAASKGKSEADVVGALLGARKAALDARVKAGTITQAQADTAYKFMEQRIKDSVNRTQVGPNRPADGQGLGLGMGHGRGAGSGFGQPGSGGRWGGQPPVSR